MAKQADLSLVVDHPPEGTFNYIDAKEDTSTEAMDLFPNGILLTKGSTRSSGASGCRPASGTLSEGLPRKVLSRGHAGRGGVEGSSSLSRELPSRAAVDPTVVSTENQQTAPGSRQRTLFPWRPEPTPRDRRGGEHASHRRGDPIDARGGESRGNGSGSGAFGPGHLFAEVP